VCAELVCGCGADIVQKSCEEEGFCIYGPGWEVGGLDCAGFGVSSAVSLDIEALGLLCAIRNLRWDLPKRNTRMLWLNVLSGRCVSAYSKVCLASGVSGKAKIGSSVSMAVGMTGVNREDTTLESARGIACQP